MKLYLLVLLLFCFSLVVSKKALTTNSKKGSIKSKPSKHRTSQEKRKKPYNSAIIPTKNEKVAERAIRSFSTIGNELYKSANSAISTTGKLKRDIKAYFSSDFEVLLLRMTMPDNHKIDKYDMSRFLATTESFVRNMDLTTESNPYRVTLRKLWSKIIETDHRTVVKALILLHTLLLSSYPEDAVIYKNLILTMSKETYKKSNQYYFDTTNIATHVHDTQDNCKRFLKRYASYVLKRSKAFTAEFEELKLISHNMKTEDICAQLLKAKKLISAILKCKLAVEEENSEVVISTLQLLAQDLGELTLLFVEKLNWLVKEHELGDVFEGWQKGDVEDTLAYFRQFYLDSRDEIESFCKEATDLLSLYHIKTITRKPVPELTL